jgi:hypothetical protein
MLAAIIKQAIFQDHKVAYIEKGAAYKEAQSTVGRFIIKKDTGAFRVVVPQAYIKSKRN